MTCIYVANYFYPPSSIGYTEGTDTSVCPPILGTNLGQTRTVGTSESEESDSSSNAVTRPAYTGLLLDFDSQAECTGTAAVWHYCFYLESSSSYYSQVAEFGVYRMQESGNYARVRESHRRVEVHNEYSLLVPDFICQSITMDEPFSVLEGDLIGACLLNDPTNNIYALDLLAIADVSHKLHRRNTCTSSEVDPLSSEWSLISRMALHLYLEINYTTVSSTVSPIASTYHPSEIGKT